VWGFFLSATLWVGLLLCSQLRLLLCGAGGFVWCFGLSAGIRGLTSWCGRVGLLVFLLASALCLRASSVAPVRGGTYFSLPPQRKVGEGLNNPFFALDF
jgi:hypothetical protein